MSEHHWNHLTDHLAFHSNFSAADFDAGYNLRARRPDFEESVIKVWQAGSEAARASLDSTLDHRYGSGERQRMDIFRCGDSSAPTLVFFHGGYWKSGDKSIYSFLAAPFTAVGVNVVIAGYDLCPTITVTQICKEAREALVHLWQHSAKLGLNQDRIIVMGHSAGGHITQMMMATNWPAIEAGLPKDLIKAGIPLSPVSYLEPVRLTPAVNDGVGLTEEEAEAQSPMTSHPPVTNAPQLVAVGGGETDEFLRQATMYADTYRTAMRHIELMVVPEVDHFDLLNVLVDAQSIFFKSTCKLMDMPPNPGAAGI